jgi:protein-S-isoprenylcysteine O-methyltransferase Ste14/polyisoprenoid-binding protein YceI
MKESPMKKILSFKINFILVGIVNMVVFPLALFQLWQFLQGKNHLTLSDNSPSGWVYAVLIDLSLLSLFTLPHSFLLNSRIKTSLQKHIPQPLYSTIYSLHASVSLILMNQFWIKLSPPLYTLTGGIEHAIFIAYVVSWLLMTYAMYSTGFFRQSGIAEWFWTLKGRTYQNEIPKVGFYKICRQPIYTAFMGMIWMVPTMGIDRLALAVVWTGYLFYGTFKKERRLSKNKTHQLYAQSVRLYPFWSRKMETWFFSYGESIQNFCSLKWQKKIWRFILESFNQGLALKILVPHSFKSSKTFMMLLVFFFYLANISVSASSQPTRKMIKITGQQSSENFSSASQSPTQLKFTVTSTKAGIITSDVDGYVKKFHYQADYDPEFNIVRNMIITFDANQMDTDHEDRNQKLHQLCMSSDQFPQVQINLTGPISLSAKKNSDLVGQTLIRGKSHEFTVSVIGKNDQDLLTIEGDSVWGLKKMEIPDPSIWIATLSDEIKIYFKIVHRQ